MTHKVSEPACLLAPRVGHVVKKHSPHTATRDPQTIRETTYKKRLDNVRYSLTIITPGAGQTSNTNLNESKRP